MSNSEQPITDAEIENRPKRKYTKSGNPRFSLWKSICEEHNIKKFKKGTPEYTKIREIYDECLKLRKSKIQICNTETNYVDEPDVSKNVVQNRSKDLLKNTK